MVTKSCTVSAVDHLGVHRIGCTGSGGVTRGSIRNLPLGLLATTRSVRRRGTAQRPDRPGRPIRHCGWSFRRSRFRALARGPPLRRADCQGYPIDDGIRPTATLRLRTYVQSRSRGQGKGSRRSRSAGRTLNIVSSSAPTPGRVYVSRTTVGGHRSSILQQEPLRVGHCQSIRDELPVDTSHRRTPGSPIRSLARSTEARSPRTYSILVRTAPDVLASWMSTGASVSSFVVDRQKAIVPVPHAAPRAVSRYI